MTIQGKRRYLALLSIAALAVAPVASAETPTASDFASCNAQAADAVKSAPSALPRMGSTPDASGGILARRPDAPQAVAPAAQARSTDPTGQVVTNAADPQLAGMDTKRAAEPEYRAAYKRCMRQRGF